MRIYPTEEEEEEIQHVCHLTQSGIYHITIHTNTPFRMFQWKEKSCFCNAKWHLLHEAEAANQIRLTVNLPSVKIGFWAQNNKLEISIIKS